MTDDIIELFAEINPDQHDCARHEPSNTRSQKEHKARINEAWLKGTAAYFETGQYLLDAKTELDGDAFEALSKQELHFDPSVGRKLMRIASNSVLCAHVHKLPNSWSTAYELSKLDDDILKAAIADGRIHPKMERKDAVALRPKKPDHEEGPRANGEDAAPAASESTNNVNVGAPSPTTNVTDSPKGKTADSAAKNTEETDTGADQNVEDPSVAQRRAEHEALFAEPAAAVPETVSADDQVAIAAAAVNRLDAAELKSLLDQISREHQNVLRRHFARDNVNKEIAKEARDSSALLAHAAQNADAIRKKLARIVRLTGAGTKARSAPEKSNAKLDHGAFARGMGLAGQSGNKFRTMQVVPIT
jgi:hypothetical protein